MTSVFYFILCEKGWGGGREREIVRVIERNERESEKVPPDDGERRSHLQFYIIYI